MWTFNMEQYVVTVNTSIYIINLQLLKSMLRFVPKVLVSDIAEVKWKNFR